MTCRLKSGVGIRVSTLQDIKLRLDLLSPIGDGISLYVAVRDSRMVGLVFTRVQSIIRKLRDPDIEAWNGLREILSLSS
jgi:hypothetical protein